MHAKQASDAGRMTMLLSSMEGRYVIDGRADVFGLACCVGDQAIVVARRSRSRTCLHHIQVMQCLYTRQVLLVDPQTADHRRTPLEVVQFFRDWERFLPACRPLTPPDMIFTELEV